jgi:hypothetical protein
MCRLGPAMVSAPYLKPQEPHARSPANDINDTFQLSMVMSTGLGVRANGNCARPQLIRTRACACDGSSPIHARRLWRVEIELSMLQRRIEPLRGRTLSADAALQTAGVAAYGQPTGRRALPEQAQCEKSQGVRGTESPDSFDNTAKKSRITCPFFRGKYRRSPSRSSTIFSWSRSN